MRRSTSSAIRPSHPPTIRRSSTRPPPADPKTDDPAPPATDPPVVLPPPSPANPPTRVLPPPAPKASATVANPKVTSTTVSAIVTCSTAARCRGRVTFTYKRMKLGSSALDVTAGKRKTVSVKLAKATARKLPRKPKVTAAVELAAQS